jgi:hypothetical protein
MNKKISSKKQAMKKKATAGAKKVRTASKKAATAVSKKVRTSKATVKKATKKVATKVKSKAGAAKKHSASLLETLQDQLATGVDKLRKAVTPARKTLSKTLGKKKVGRPKKATSRKKKV